jgi:hypothetical protein
MGRAISDLDRIGAYGRRLRGLDSVFFAAFEHLVWGHQVALLHRSLRKFSRCNDKVK